MAIFLQYQLAALIFNVKKELEICKNLKIEKKLKNKMVKNGDIVSILNVCVENTGNQFYLNFCRYGSI